MDFSASINPLGPPPCVWEAMSSVDLSVYPDPDCLALQEALSATLGVPPQCITIGNGSTELIHLLARACLSEGDEALILSPTFGEYEVACRLTGAIVAPLYAAESRGFQWDMDSTCRLIRLKKPRLVFLCNPNNPTGVYLPRSDVFKLAEATGEYSLLVVDEAYIAFTQDRVDETALGLLDLGNVVVLRSMTKDYALTGLRLGYGVAPEEVSRLLSAFQPGWSVNALAQAAGLAALSDSEHLDAARECVRQGKAYLERELKALSLKVTPSAANFLLVDVGDAAGVRTELLDAARECVRHGKAYLERELQALSLKVTPSAANFLLVDVGDAAGVRTELLCKGVCVRDCTSFGLPRHIRVGVRTIPDCQRLVQGLMEVLRTLGVHFHPEQQGDPGRRVDFQERPRGEPRWLWRVTSNMQSKNGGAEQ